MANVLTVNNLSISYGNRQALKDVYLTVKDNEFLGIIGPNGGGKSTLLKAILSLIPLSNGEIIFGEGLSRNDVGYVPQIALMDKSFPISVLEVVLTGLMRKGAHPFFRYNSADKQKAIDELSKVGISHLARRQISELSGGEFQKMLLARALISRPKILLLDEPTANIDPSSAEHIYSLLKELNKSLTIIMVTHDLMAISSEVTDLACLNKTLVYHGEPELTHEILDSLYGCPVDLIAHGIPHRVLAEHSHESEEKTK